MVGEKEEGLKLERKKTKEQKLGKFKEKQKNFLSKMN